MSKPLEAKQEAMRAEVNPVSLREAKRLVSAMVRDSKTPADVFLKGILFLERTSTWRRRNRKPRQESDVFDIVRKIEQSRKDPTGKPQ